MRSSKTCASHFPASGLDLLFCRRFKNVFFCSIEGIPDKEGIFAKMQRVVSSHNSYPDKLGVRIIPFMYVAGLRVDQDLLGDVNSYKTQLEELGFTVECLTAEYSGERFHKGLGFYEGIRKAFLDRLRRSLDLMRYC